MSYSPIREEIRPGVIISIRRLIQLGHSKVVSLPQPWLKMQIFKGNKLNKIALVAFEDFIVLTTEDKIEHAIKVVRALADDGRTE